VASARLRRRSPKRRPPCFLTSRRPPGRTAFPYTTLFRSSSHRPRWWFGSRSRARCSNVSGSPSKRAPGVERACASAVSTRTSGRSEEHTSELQSRENLVCRLLLEKKKAGEKEGLKPA